MSKQKYGGKLTEYFVKHLSCHPVDCERGGLVVSSLFRTQKPLAAMLNNFTVLKEKEEVGIDIPTAAH